MVWKFFTYGRYFIKCFLIMTVLVGAPAWKIGVDKAYSVRVSFVGDDCKSVGSYVVGFDVFVDRFIPKESDPSITAWLLDRAYWIRLVDSAVKASLAVFCRCISEDVGFKIEQPVLLDCNYVESR